MKIAVCLSGQPRVAEYVIPSILNYFSGEHEYDFFCHSWDYNNYKRKIDNPGNNPYPVWWEDEEPVDPEYVKQCLSKLSPKACVIDSKQVLQPPDNRRYAWDSLTYSMMYANHLKKQYEVQNNFRYDFVIKTRYDIVYYPNDKFKLSINAHKQNYHDIFTCHAGRMPVEFNRINASDVVFYGSSLVMDMITDLYRIAITRGRNSNFDDYECLGPGTLLSHYGDNRNIKFQRSEIYNTVYRKEMIPLDPLTNFERINNFNQSLYVVQKDYD